MPLRCFKSEGSRIFRLQELILLPWLLILSFLVGGGWAMTDGEVKEMRYNQKECLRLPS